MGADALNRLMDYTIFHIGVYLSLTTAFMGASILKSLHHPVIRWAVFWFLAAGACGGIVAANLAEYTGEAPDFINGIYILKFHALSTFSYPTFAAIEHAAFWVGILPLAFIFIAKKHVNFTAP